MKIPLRDKLLTPDNYKLVCGAYKTKRPTTKPVKPTELINQQQ
ncbi:hypothetical protein [Pseudoalteromonas obscura]|uniref:Orphan protein n=1 Tax=Pseudoalteromonas obscura TaxID=3048491 RepID=A0ABT7ELX8_9GAMM|nr:hypothetical protein [Pseudoalteromonas sp. P94(2023)]MDK2596028.1 hypothetical protein [Pseudoalteromonas sp. P94(2023)]